MQISGVGPQAERGCEQEPALVLEDLVATLARLDLGDQHGDPAVRGGALRLDELDDRGRRDAARGSEDDSGTPGFQVVPGGAKRRRRRRRTGR